MHNRLPSEIFAILGNIDPDAYTAATYTTGWVAAANWQSLAAIIQAGDLGASATLNAKIQQASDSGGTGAKDLTNAAITALTQAGTDDNKQAIIQFRPEDLDVDNGFTHVRLSMTVGTATSDAGGMLLGFGGRTGPAADSDSATVDEIVTVA